MVGLLAMKKFVNASEKKIYWYNGDYRTCKRGFG